MITSPLEDWKSNPPNFPLTERGRPPRDLRGMLSRVVESSQPSLLILYGSSKSRKSCSANAPSIQALTPCRFKTRSMYT